MPRKRKTIQKGNKTLYYCSLCGQYKPEYEFPKWKNMGKIRLHSYCKECERKRETKRAETGARQKAKERFRNSLKGKIRQKVDDYLYKKDEKFRKSMEIFKQNDERRRRRSEYKRNYIIFNVPEEVITDEEKAILFDFASVEELDERRRKRLYKTY